MSYIMIARGPKLKQQLFIEWVLEGLKRNYTIEESNFPDPPQEAITYLKEKGYISNPTKRDKELQNDLVSEKLISMHQKIKQKNDLLNQIHQEIETQIKLRTRLAIAEKRIAHIEKNITGYEPLKIDYSAIEERISNKIRKEQEDQQLREKLEKEREQRELEEAQIKAAEDRLNEYKRKFRDKKFSSSATS